MAKWYYSTGASQTGPVEASELKRLATTGQLKPDDRVRKDDMKSWVRANQVAGLFSAPTAIATVGSQEPRLVTTEKVGDRLATNKLSFRVWYGKGLGRRNILVQILAWTILAGYMWIPLLWMATSHRILFGVLIAFIFVTLLFYKPPTEERTSVSNNPVEPAPAVAHEVLFGDDRLVAYKLRIQQTAPLISEKIVELHSLTSSLKTELVAISELYESRKFISYEVTTEEVLKANEIIAAVGIDNLDVFTDASEWQGRSLDGMFPPEDLAAFAYYMANDAEALDYISAAVDSLRIFQAKFKGRILEQIVNAQSRLQEIKDIGARRQVEQLAIERWRNKIAQLGNPDDIAQQWAKALSLSREISNWLKAAQREQEDLLGQEPEPLDGLFFIDGITWLIQGDLYYLKGENRVIKIPPEYANLYVRRGGRPNLAIVNGSFRFTGNSSGRNAFGATVPIETYVVDVAHSTTISQFWERRARINRELGDLKDSPINIDSLPTLIDAFETFAGKQLADDTRELVKRTSSDPQ